MRIVIIDHGSGNLHSAERAFAHVADHPVEITSRPEAVAAADYIVLPGVGAFADCLAGLAALDGMRDALEERVIRQGRPFLGICVGMQLMCARGLEDGTHKGFGWLDGDIAPLFDDIPNGLKVPHMGWNDIETCAPHPVLDGLDRAHFYFVHGYAARNVAPVARADYGGAFAAALGRDNLFGTQFHPEKSQAAGQRLIENFLGWRP